MPLTRVVKFEMRRARSGLARCLFVFAAAGFTTATAAPDVNFVQKVIATGDALQQTVVTGSFSGGRFADVAVVSTVRHGARTLRLHTFDGNDWSPALVQQLRDDVVFVDVARIDGRDTLLTYDNAAFRRIDPVSGDEQVLVPLAAGFNAPADHEIPSVNVTRDLNNDGRDDIILPAFDGFWIALQLTDGTFTAPVKKGPPEPFLDEVTFGDERRYRQQGISAETVPWYLSRTHSVDFNLDGYKDLVFWNGKNFDVYRQLSDRRFADEPVTVAPGVPFDADGVYSLVFGFEEANTFKLLSGFRKKTGRTVLHSFRDLNNDGIADLLTVNVTGRSILRQRSTYFLYLGRKTDDGLAFSDVPDATIRPKGKAGLMQASGYASQHFADFNNDGRTDILFQDVAVGVGGMARTLIGNSVPINLEFFINDNGSYPERASERRKVRRFAPLAGVGNVYFPAVLTGDFNGDGRPDLAVGHGAKRLHVYEGIDDDNLFTRKPQVVAVELPPDERRIRAVHLNGDDKLDLLVEIGPTDREPDTRRRLLTLFAL